MEQRPPPQPTRYAPELLRPIPRTETRAGLAWEGSAAPFDGVDIWRAWELCCRDRRGRPQQFLARFCIPAASACLPESKSLKLYLHSLAEQRIGGAEELCALLSTDLGALLSTRVEVQCFPAHAPGADWQPGELPGRCLDALPLAPGEPAIADASLLRRAGGHRERELLHTHLFRSRCPMTAQPDWASILVRYTGPALEEQALLSYLLSFRFHQGFHEECVERIFCDLLQCLAPGELAVSGFFLRRGGIDISPVRHLPGETPPEAPRLLRQ